MSRSGHAAAARVAAGRSTLPIDYQTVPRPVAVMVKDFGRSTSTGRHAHARAQVLYATTGLMVATTDAGTWAVPTGHALLIPPKLVHEITMHGDVRMVTAYVTTSRWRRFATGGCRVIHASRLLDAALEAIAEEPVRYGQRGERLAALVLEEVQRGTVARLALPLPRGPRLRAMCERLLADPGIDADIDAWAASLALSRRTLTRHFSGETGLSFGEWRRRLRRLHGMRLAAEGMPMKEIASRVGYRSGQALGAMMRRATVT